MRSSSLARWLLYTSINPDDLATHSNPLLWVHKHKQHHKKRRKCRCPGVAGFKPCPRPSLLNPKQTTGSERPWGGMSQLTSFMTDFSSVWVSQPLNAEHGSRCLCIYFHFLMRWIQWSVGMRGVALMVVISSGVKTSRVWEGRLDELHQQVGLIRDIPGWLSELQPVEGVVLPLDTLAAMTKRNDLTLPAGRRKRKEKFSLPLEIKMYDCTMLKLSTASKVRLYSELTIEPDKWKVKAVV